MLAGRGLLRPLYVTLPPTDEHARRLLAAGPTGAGGEADIRAGVLVLAPVHRPAVGGVFDALEREGWPSPVERRLRRAGTASRGLVLSAAGR